jgi:hypothetical protein
MATIIESWEKHLLSEADRINRSRELSKDEKAARIHGERAQMVHRARVTLGDYKSRLEGERNKLNTLLSVRHKKSVYPATEVGQLMRMNDLTQASQFKAELSGLSERNFIRLFEMKWNEGDLFSVNLMLDCAEEILGAPTLVRFNEQYKRLSAEGFSLEEKSALSNIRSYEAEIKALESFLEKEKDNEDKCAG